MTINEAIQILETDQRIDPLVKGFALDALKKQQPVHPINHINLGSVCKSCGWILERTDHYCPGCGSRIDWSWMNEARTKTTR